MNHDKTAEEVSVVFRYTVNFPAAGTTART